MINRISQPWLSKIFSHICSTFDYLIAAMFQTEIYRHMCSVQKMRTLYTFSELGRLQAYV